MDNTIHQSFGVTSFVSIQSGLQEKSQNIAPLYLLPVATKLIVYSHNRRANSLLGYCLLCPTIQNLCNPTTLCACVFKKVWLP